MKSQFTFRKLKSLLYLPSILYQNHFILSSMKETNQLIRPLVSNYSTQKAIDYTQGTTKTEPLQSRRKDKNFPSFFVSPND